MPRIRPLTKDEVSPEVRKIMEAGERARGEVLLSHGVAAYSPPILEANSVLGAAPARSHSLPAELRSLVCLRVAQLAGCPF
jgi:alkylhydroperoxidase family enzyme